MLFVLAVAVLGGIGYAIGNGKGRGVEGALWGALLGIIGVVVIALRGPAPGPDDSV